MLALGNKVHDSHCLIGSVGLARSAIHDSVEAADSISHLHFKIDP